MMTSVLKRGLIAALLALCFAGTAEAHLAPRTLGVVRYDAGARPQLLLTTYGLVLREDEVWRYVCPVRHGGPDTPPAIAADDRTWLVTIDGAQLFEPDLTPLTDKFGDVTVVALPELAVLPEGAFALVLEGKGSALYRLREEGPERIFADRDPWQDLIATDDGLLLARTTTASVVEFTELDAAGTVTSTYGVPRLAWEVSLHASPDGAQFAVATDAVSSVVMERVGGVMEIVFETPGIVGAVTRLGGRMFVSIDSALHVVNEGVATPTGDDRQVTCFGHGPAGAYACSNLQVYAMADDGALGEPVFLMPWVESPSVEGLTVDQAATCDFQWNDLRTEAGLTEPMPEPMVTEPSGGCTTAGRPSFGAALAIVLLGVGIRSSSWRRRRRRRVCPCVSSRRPCASPSGSRSARRPRS